MKRCPIKACAGELGVADTDYLEAGAVTTRMRFCRVCGRRYQTHEVLVPTAAGLAELLLAAAAAQAARLNREAGA